MDTNHRDWLLRELRGALMLLAADGDTALAGIPDGACKPDELALDYDNFGRAVLGNFDTAMPPELVVVLRRIDEMLTSFTKDCWTEDAVRRHPAWQAVRDQAELALALFDRWVSELV